MADPDSETATAGASGRILSLAVEFAANSQCRNLASLIQSSSCELATSFVTVPLFLSEPREPLAYSDLCLSFDQWSTLAVGVVSDDAALWSDDPVAASGAVQRVRRELSWAKHLALSAVVLPRPPADPALLPRYAARLYSAVLELGASSCQFWVRIRLHGCDPDLSYRTWRKLRALFEDMTSLYPVLEPVGDQVKEAPSRRALQRWNAEDVAAVVLDRSFPKPAWVESLLTDLFRYDVRVLVGVAESEADLAKFQPVCEWAHALWHRQPPPTEAETFVSSYCDVLQVPLQPLGDHLQSQTYEIFEKDPVKYERYEEAVYRALSQRGSARDADGDEREIVVMVVGAGRGPLVHCVLSASERARRPVRLFALEKNPNACVTLRHLCAAVWGEQRVEVIEGDMRAWEAPVQADILVSELLGSFGDNELSPECLDGARRLLRHDGISIPSSYTSYLAPVSCPRLWGQLASSGLRALETLHVVQLHAFFGVAPPQDCFTFSHPDNATNDRRRVLSFIKDVDEVVVHGFAGYFRAVLYEGIDEDPVEISIEPSTFSEGMFSWFPALLPLRHPVVWRSDDPLRIEISRTSRADQRRVWYEWVIEHDDIVSSISNPNGRSYSIDL